MDRFVEANVNLLKKENGKRSCASESNMSQGRKELYRVLSSFVSAVLRLWKPTGYFPERHYMRGPGPKWREKH